MKSRPLYLPAAAFIILTMLATSLLSGSAPAYAETPSLKFKDHGRLVKELSLGDLEKIMRSQKIKIADALEDDDVTYDAFAVNELLEKIYGQVKGAAEEILFTCADGFQPSVPMNKFNENDAYLAFKREDKASFEITNQREAGKKISVGPFYLVWKKKKASDPDDVTSWPYQVVSLDLVTFAAVFPKLAPPAHSPQKVVRGFLAFRNNCVGCHTLNGDGGKGGPELNYPVNITEYYKIDWLKKWIGNPTSIRFKTGMPGLDKNMPGRDQVIDDIVDYFEAMKKNKIKP